MAIQYGPKIFGYVVTMTAEPDTGAVIRGGAAVLILFLFLFLFLGLVLLLLDAFPRPFNWMACVFFVIFTDSLAGWKGKVRPEKAGSSDSLSVHSISITYWLFQLGVLSIGAAVVVKVLIIVWK